MKEHYSVGLYIYSDNLSPREITSVVGLEPSDSFRRGDRKGKSEKILYKVNGWILQKHCDNQYAMMELLVDFLKELKPYQKAIRTLSHQGHTVQISLGITSVDGRPILYFDRSTVKMLCDLGADFDIDEYIFPEPE